MEVLVVLKDLAVGLAWPILFLVLARKFEPELRQRISHLVKAGVGGVEFAQPTTPQASLPAKQLPPTVPVVAKEERRIEEFLAAHPDKDPKEVLKRELAISSVRVASEAVFGNLYGSQLNFLNLLQNSGGDILRPLAETFFEGIKAADKAYTELSFEDWLQYLTVNNLVVLDGETIRMTEFGAAFTPYAIARAQVSPRRF